MSRILTNYITFALLTLSTLSKSHAQGSIFFSNHVVNYGIDAPVFDSAANRLQGSRYRAAMYAGSAQTFLQFRADTEFLTGPQSGYFDGGVIIENDFQPGVPLWVQVTAWDTMLGGSFEAVKSLGIGGYGESTPFQVVPGNPGGGVPSLPGFFENMQSFSLLPVVPEPNPFWILAVSLPFFYLVRRIR
jgi:hypothetical protein